MLPLVLLCVNHIVISGFSQSELDWEYIMFNLISLRLCVKCTTCWCVGNNNGMWKHVPKTWEHLWAMNKWKYENRSSCPLSLYPYRSQLPYISYWHLPLVYHTKITDFCTDIYSVDKSSCFHISTYSWPIYALMSFHMPLVYSYVVMNMLWYFLCPCCMKLGDSLTVCLQVLNFVQEFADLLPDYQVACEHEHSNCVLIAHKKVQATS